MPDALCIGAQRFGTTWLQAALQLHPRIWPREIKEFHQFDWDGRDPRVGEFRQRQALAALTAVADAGAAGTEREQRFRRLLRHAFPPAHSWESYAAMFAAAPPDGLACDFKPAYATLDENQVDDIVRVMPHLEVIFILRDPVARAVSGALRELGMSGIAAPTEAELRHACDAASNVLRTDYRDATADCGWRSRVSRRDICRRARRAGLVVERQETTWAWHSPAGPCRIGVPRFGDCITVLRRVDRGRGV